MSLSSYCMTFTEACKLNSTISSARQKAVLERHDVRHASLHHSVFSVGVHESVLSMEARVGMYAFAPLNVPQAYIAFSAASHKDIHSTLCLEHCACND